MPAMSLSNGSCGRTTQVQLQRELHLSQDEAKSQDEASVGEPPPGGRHHPSVARLLEPKYHGRPLIAPSANSPSGMASKGTTPFQEKRSANLTSISTVDELWHKGYGPQAFVLGSRRSGNGDFWAYTADGRHAIRVHLRARGTLYGVKGRSMTRPPGRRTNYEHGTSPVRSHSRPL